MSATEEISDNNRLTNTSLPREEAVLFVFNKFVQDVLVLNGIAGGHKNVEVWSFWIIFKLGDHFGPVVELFLFEVDEVVVDLVFVGEG